jgi:STE24 endopeptidase
VTAAIFTAIFLIALVASLGANLWLARRQIRFVTARRTEVPPAFADRIALPAHQKAADYTVARTRFGMIETIVEALLLLALTLGGGLAALVAWTATLGLPSLGADLALIAAVAVVAGVVGLPFSYINTFGIEAKFGFNRTTRAVWIADIAKGVAVAAALGLPLAALILWLMRAAGPYWWLWAWLAWIAFQFLVLALYPTLIAPLFNKFSPLPEGPARSAIEALLARCGFESKGLYVMDGSRRSSHGNAFFTGFGRAKRIVFFDTLLARLAPEEIEAVLAHELGHFRLHHVLKRMAWSAALALGFLALLALLASAPWFYEGLGVPAATERPGVALLLFFLALPVFTFMLGPLSSLYSRRHEFEADAFAARNASAPALVHALVKLYEDNASTLTPDPLYSAVHDSHPPAALRIARLRVAGAAAH